MTKKAKREQRRRQRLTKAFDAAMGSVKRKCPKCRQMVVILPINSWATCSCGELIRR